MSAKDGPNGHNNCDCHPETCSHGDNSIGEKFTQDEMILFAEFCFRKYLIEGVSELVTHQQLFELWSNNNNKK